MKERLEQLKKLLEDMRSDSFSDQYGIADFVEGNQKAIDELAEESQFYTNLISQTNNLLDKLKGEKLEKHQCAYCFTVYEGKPLEYCCDGQMCGCQGQPIYPPLCSKDCGMRLIDTRDTGNIDAYNKFLIEKYGLLQVGSAVEDNRLFDSWIDPDKTFRIDKVIDDVYLLVNLVSNIHPQKYSRFSDCVKIIAKNVKTNI